MESGNSLAGSLYLSQGVAPKRPANRVFRGNSTTSKPYKLFILFMKYLLLSATVAYTVAGFAAIATTLSLLQGRWDWQSAQLTGYSYTLARLFSALRG